MDVQLELLLTATTTVFLVCGVKFRWFRRTNNHLPPPFTADDNNGDGRYCAVCLNDVIGGETCRKLPKCEHVFHVECVDAWLKSNWTCPLCRRQVTDQLPKPKGETVISRAEDFILEKIYNPITETVTMVLFGGMFISHP
ncbi:RING-H2 finger protein ATL3 [Capsicum galapagoense]